MPQPPRCGRGRGKHEMLAVAITKRPRESDETPIPQDGHHATVTADTLSRRSIEQPGLAAGLALVRHFA